MKKDKELNIVIKKDCILINDETHYFYTELTKEEIKSIKKLINEFDLMTVRLKK